MKNIKVFFSFCRKGLEGKLRFLGISMLLLVMVNACSDKDKEDAGTQQTNVNANEAGYARRLEFPRLKNTNTVLLVHTSEGEVNYSVEWDKKLQSQHWSCYAMYESNMVNKTSRYYGQPQYPADPMYVTEDFIYGSGYDHGHICPSADRLNSFEQNYQTFFLTNMQPQLKGFNGSISTRDGIWLNMENAVRSLGEQRAFCDTLYVCKGGTIGVGGTLNNQILERKSNGLIVPGYFFVALLRVYRGQYNAIGLLFKHENNRDTYLGNYAMSIDELEAKTGFDFFCNLPDQREAVIESQCIPSLWKFRTN